MSYAARSKRGPAKLLTIDAAGTVRDVPRTELASQFSPGDAVPTGMRFCRMCILDRPSVPRDPAQDCFALAQETKRDKARMAKKATSSS